MFDTLTSWDNLLLAYDKASRRKRGRGNVAAFEYRLEENLYQMQQELQSQTYRPGGYTSFFIHEPKKRLISAAPFWDRVVHHALCNLIEPLFERTFIEDSYANRIGKGTHKARDRCQAFARRYRYVLACDIRQFFPSLDHAILRDQLAQKMSDDRVLWLIDQILASGEGVLSEQDKLVYFPIDLKMLIWGRGWPCAQQFSICPEMNVGAGQVGQDFGQTGALRSHLSRPALAETEEQRGVRQAGIRLNRLTQMVARLSHPYHRL